MKIITLSILIISLSSSFCESGGVLNLLESQRLALKNNPALQAFAYEIESHDGLIEQAGYSPNPVFEFEAENFLGSGDFQGVEGIETTLGISQTFETSGKNNKRVHLANRGKKVVQDQFDITRLNIVYQTTDAYLHTLYTQERLEVEQSFYEISRKTLETIQAGVEAGRDSPLEEVRAKVTASSSQIALERIQKLHEKNKLVLASHWSSTSPSFDAIDGSLLPLPRIPDVEHMMNFLPDHPEINKAKSELNAQESFLNLQKAKASPDFEISAGVRYLSEVDDGAFVVGFSMPLPLRNRNQGAIRAAKEQIKKSEKDREKIEFELKSKLYQTYVEYDQSFQEAALLQNDILPNAQTAFQSALEGYRLGKFSYLTVLDAQRALFELEIQLLESAFHVHQSINRIHYLAGNYEVMNIRQKEIEQ
ncbi:MAG: TolC family protein [Candidatus Omnitrophica bacterium]|nr:TolC family protein [Candidatus Omnitrophota bacterium]